MKTSAEQILELVYQHIPASVTSKDVDKLREDINLQVGVAMDQARKDRENQIVDDIVENLWSLIAPPLRTWVHSLTAPRISPRRPVHWPTKTDAHLDL